MAGGRVPDCRAVASAIFREDLLQGQVALVSGGGTGIGRATALELATLGAEVLVCGRREGPLQETAALHRGGRIHHRVCDIRDEDQVERLVDGVLERLGRVDVLVNNAGGQFLAPAEQITPKGFRTVLRLNVERTWHDPRGRHQGDDPRRRRQGRERHDLAPPRLAGGWPIPPRPGRRWRT